MRERGYHSDLFDGDIDMRHRPSATPGKPHITQSHLPISFHVGFRQIPYWVSIDPTDAVTSRAPLVKVFKKVRLSTHGR